MNYKAIYDSIVENRKSVPYEGYTERHHILPRSLGGSDDAYNIVRLSAKEHYMCHLLLTRIYQKDTYQYHKMICAFMFMSNGIHDNRYIGSRNYEYLKSEHAKAISRLKTGIQTTSTLNKMWIHNADVEQSKMIDKTSTLPDGWEVGKCVNWKGHYKNRECKICKTIGCMSKRSLFCSKKCKVEQLSKTMTRERNMNISNALSVKVTINNTLIYKRIDSVELDYYLNLGWIIGKLSDVKIDRSSYDAQIDTQSSDKSIKYTEMYLVYNSHGFKYMCDMYDYKYTLTNFAKMCKRYVSEYKSQKGKQRGTNAAVAKLDTATPYEGED